MSTPETPAPLSSPDITSMQKLVGALTAVITTAVSLASAFGANITAEQGIKIMALWAALGGLAVVADAIIRQGRAKAHAAITIAAAAAQAAPPTLVVSTTAKRKPAARRKPAATTPPVPGA